MLTTTLFCAVGLQVGLAEEENMSREDLQITIDAQRVAFTAPPVLREGKWFVPLEPFAKQLGLKVEYPEGTKMAVLCGGASELCVPLEFQDIALQASTGWHKGVVDIDGVTYVQPAQVTEPFGFEIYEVSVNRLEIIQSMHLAPEFTLPDLEGTPRRLRDFRGKKTLLYVWGSW
ncbi:hypothetical protein C6500_18745 [Candidatus Poribacteria bacterium]|nr:MAG: hypothetical protein C6500_18745 [Candidatus Poribacteria bacterium]